MTDALKPRTREEIEQEIADEMETGPYPQDYCDNFARARYDEIRASILAEMAEQEPFGYFRAALIGTNWSGATLKRERNPKSDPQIPLYAHPMPPADQTAEVLELRRLLAEALEIVPLSEGDWLDKATSALNAPQPEARKGGK